MASWDILLTIALVVVPHAGLTFSAPTNSRVFGTGTERYGFETVTNGPPSETWSTPANSITGVTENGGLSTVLAATGAHNDYIISDNEYQQVLDRLRAEAEATIVSDPRNYAPYGVSMVEIIRMIDESSGGSSTPALPGFESTTGSSSEDRFVVTEEEQEGEEEVDEDSQPKNEAEVNDDQRSQVSMATTTVRPEVGHYGDDCSICLEEMVEQADRLVTLLCGHQFHLNCIRKWKFSSSLDAKCPMCRSYIVGADSNIEATTVASHYSPRHRCSICRESLEPYNDVLTLLCGHTFHQGCIHRWRNGSNRCPNCQSEGFL